VGTKISILNGHPILSLGLHDLDYLLHEGVSVGSMLLVQEDVLGSVSDLLMNYFLGEGVASGHSCFVASCDPSHVIATLPFINGLQQNDETHRDVESDSDLKIAWQYEKYIQNNQDLSSTRATRDPWCHSFDLTKKMQNEYIQNANIETYNIMDYNGEDIFNGTTSETLELIREKAENNRNAENILPHRYIIHSLGSPLWGELNEKKNYFNICTLSKKL